MGRLPKLRKVQQNESVRENLRSNSSLILSRTKRTPKPNPKYVNDEIVSKVRGQRRSSSNNDSQLRSNKKEEESDSDEELHQKVLTKNTLPNVYVSLESNKKITADLTENRKNINETSKVTPSTEKKIKQNDEVLTSKVIEKKTRKRNRNDDDDDSDFEMIYSSSEQESSEEIDDDEDDKDFEIDKPKTRKSDPIQKTKMFKTSTPKVIKSTPALSNKIRQQILITKKPNVNESLQSKKITSTTPMRRRSTSPKLRLNMSKGTDFEADVPTFTIVNINDIIKKGPDSPVKNIDDDNNNIDEDDDDINILPSMKNAKDSNYLKSNTNRRKTQHTKILTDDFETKTKSNAQQKSLQRSPINNNNSYDTKNNRKSNENQNVILNNIKKTLNPTTPTTSASNKFNNNAPRILNSMLARKKLDGQPLKTDNKEIKPPLMNKKNISKENVKTNLNSSNRTLNNRTRLQALMESKPKIVYDMEGGKRVKKITCYETWYVINIPNTEIPVPKPQVILSLIKLGNEIKKISLPSDEWKYRITLTRLSKEPSGTSDIYQGEVQDENIKESEKHKYEPITIAFRRNNVNKHLRMQYDRTIIFKNHSYFLNVDGKNVRLVGAPQYIRSLKEIETLIHIINDISLINPYIEPSSFVL